jgi:transcriptional regulator with GAF, ATPase, and Fis domain
VFTETAIKYSKLSTARHDTTKVLDILNEGLARAARSNNQPFQALLEMHIAKNEWLRTKYRRALAHFDKGWSLAKKLGDPKLLRSATTFSTFFLFWQGRFKEAIDTFEKSVPDVDKYPKGRFPLLAGITVGYCYAKIGQVTQGLGMLDAIRTHCLDRGDLYLASQAAGNMGAIMLSIRKIDEAIEYLERAVGEAAHVHNDWVFITVQAMLAFGYFLRGSKNRCIQLLREFLKLSKQVQATVHPYPYLMAMAWAMQQGKLPHVEGLSLKNEVFSKIRSKNVYSKGVAYRYQAYLRMVDEEPPDKIMYSLNQSSKWLSESGDTIQLAKTRLEMARLYLSLGDENQAKELTQNATEVLSAFNMALVPDDLRYLLDEPPVTDQLFREILKLGQEVASIRNDKDLVQHTITTVNRLTGAERGAVFLLDEQSIPPKLRLRGSKNLTPSQIDHPNFSSSMKMIEDVVRSGKGRIMGGDTEDGLAFFSNKIIRSRICVPMIRRNKVVGVLYHDNRLLSSAFKESDLDLLAYFAALAAIALDNAEAYQEIRRLNRKLNNEKQYYQEEHIQSLHFDEIVGQSSVLQRVMSQIEQVAKTKAAVLVTGETGVGKELVARAIHRLSFRHDKPFIRVHCSALPENLIPSELFGHERGAFTGATSRRIGRFELADGGTLFLDEMGDLPADIQTRLLRVLQTKEFERVGGTATISSDFRLISATNTNLEEEVKAKRFRADLYYRINVFPIHVPPLRERKEDIPLLAQHFLKIYSTRMRKEFDGISREDMDRLIQYDWRGNVRELENIIERGCILSAGSMLQLPELVGDSATLSSSNSGITLKESEAQHIRWALEKTGWKVRGPGGAAELLEIHPSTLAFRMKKLGIQRPAKR